MAGGLAYEVVKEPSAFLIPYCKLATLYEFYSIPLFSAFPLRKSFIQSHVKLDTVILIKNVLEEKMEILTPETKLDVWSRLFNMNNKIFKYSRQFKFDGLMSTDGTSVSVYFKSTDSSKKKYGCSKSKKNLLQQNQELYYDNHLIDISYNQENLVVIDPNKRDLLYFQGANGNKMRYTSNQRSVETGAKVIRKKQQYLKHLCSIDLLESQIPTCKTMDLEKYELYLRTRTSTMEKRKTFYKNKEFSKMKWKSYIKTQRSESKFGQDMMIVIGDWSDAGRTMKFQTSSKTKGWRTLFQRNHLKWYLIDEYKTSSLCPTCHEKIEKNFKSRPSSRPWRRKEEKMEKVLELSAFRIMKIL